MRAFLLTASLVSLSIYPQQLIKLDKAGIPKQFRKSASAPWVRLQSKASTSTLSIYTPQWNADEPDEFKGFEFDLGEWGLTLILVHPGTPRFEIQRIVVFPSKQSATLYASIPVDTAGNQLPESANPVDATLPFTMLDPLLHQALDSLTQEIGHTLPAITTDPPPNNCQAVHLSLLGRTTKDITPPKALNHVTPQFPEDARSAHFSGKILSRLLVDTDGKPRCIRVISPAQPSLQQSVVSALSQYRFTPASLAGKSVRFEITIVNSFEVR